MEVCEVRRGCCCGYKRREVKQTMKRYKEREQKTRRVGRDWMMGSQRRRYGRSLLTFIIPVLHADSFDLCPLSRRCFGVDSPARD